MSNLRKFEVQVIHEMQRTYYVGAANHADASEFAVKHFRNDFAELYEAVAPSASELEVYADEMD